MHRPTNQRNLKFVLPFAAAAILSFAAAVPQPGLAGTPEKPAFGVYDPNADFANTKGIDIEHVFMPWSNIDLASLRKADAYAAERGRELLLSVEPWSWSTDGTLPNDQLHDMILAGDYDGHIEEVCGAIGGLNTTVTIRWGHEMDSNTERYAWSLWSPEDYVTAYRRFVNECRKVAPNAKFMWSPLGEASLKAYYPGDTYVDTIGLTVFGFQQYDKDQYGREMGFTEHLAARYKLVAEYNKPVVVAEAGCAGDQVYIDRCLQELVSPGAQFTQLEGVIYFNDIDPVAWPGHGTPNWRVPSDTFDFSN